MRVDQWPHQRSKLRKPPVKQEGPQRSLLFQVSARSLWCPVRCHPSSSFHCDRVVLKASLQLRAFPWRAGSSPSRPFRCPRRNRCDPAPARLSEAPMCAIKRMNMVPRDRSRRPLPAGCRLRPPVVCCTLPCGPSPESTPVRLGCHVAAGNGSTCRAAASSVSMPDCLRIG